MDENTRPSAEESPAPPSPDPAAQAPGAPPVPAAPPESPEPEPRRRRGKIVLALVLVAVALGAMGVAGWIYYEDLTTKREAVERLDEATALVEAADKVVLDVDEVVRAEIGAEVGAQAEELAPQLPGAMDDLADALSLIEESLPDLPDEEIVYAVALEASAKARLDMLEEAGQILEANRKAAAALTLATEAWDLVLEADELSTEAVEEYNKLTREGVTKSSELTDKARENIVKAKELFSEAATGFPEVDLEGYVEYCDAKLDALEISKQADEAWLAGKPAEANTLGEKYNEAEKELVERAKELPSSPAEAIAEAYEELAGEATEAYFEARTRATEADAYLREVAGDTHSD